MKRMNTVMTIAVAALAVVAMVLMPIDAARAASQEKVLYVFGSGTDAAVPFAGVILDTAGNLYGTTVVGPNSSSGSVFELTPGANGQWTEKILHSFQQNGVDGWNPVAGLIFDTAGNLYGTTTDGGASGKACGGGGCGTVFRLTPGANGQWTETVLYSFRADGNDGNTPAGSLIFDSAGNLYGATGGGGNSGSACLSLGCGTVFKLTPGANGHWTEKVLYRFRAKGHDGHTPFAGLVFDKAGNLYGTTHIGGAFSCAGGGAPGCGTIFRLTPGANGQWTERVLHNFHERDGSFPQDNLIFDAVGNLYGTTTTGGMGKGCKAAFAVECGIVFELSPRTNGQWSERVLHTFSHSGTRDGALPSAGLVFDAAGNLYGTTGSGGICVLHGGCGTVFEMTPRGDGKWTEKVLHSFENFHDGDGPFAGLVLDAMGNLYGTTVAGGEAGQGTVFEVTP